ncbi:MAG: Pr6Pr family membrane protein [Ilumatobacteraceae bacterium]|nr:Pr6Pr family membrane protein [Ilumatobacteraceae bacterium]
MSTAHAVSATKAATPPVKAWRVALTVNALVAGVALAIKFGEAATAADPHFSSVFGRLANELCYFTIQSNMIVFGVCGALAWRPERWRAIAGVPRLVGLVCITVTGIVYYALLAGDQHFVGIAKVGDILAHAVSPLLYVGTWLVLGPRGHLRRQHARQMLVFPLFWVGLTLVRGAFIHLYPYDFVDVRTNGYVAVIVMIATLTAAAAGLGTAAVSFDMRRTQLVIRPFRTRPVTRVAELALPHRGSPADR